MKKSFIIFTGLLLSITGCKKNLEENPRTFLGPQIVLSSETGVDAAIVGIYRRILGFTGVYGWDYINLMESLVDFQHAPAGEYISNAEVHSGDWPIRGAWGTNYAMISGANLVLDNLENISGSQKKEQFEGEAKFLRARAYFDLVQFFGDIPLVVSSISNPASFQPERTPQAEVYKQIITDLKDAETLLGDKGFAGPSRVDKWVAKAYLAKVYVTMAGNPNNITSFEGAKTYQLALDKAKEIINSGKYSINVSYPDVFFKTGDAETIWEFRCTDQNNSNIMSFLAMTLFTPEQKFIDSFDPSDIRGPAWGIRTSITHNGTNYPFDGNLPTYIKFVDTLQWTKKLTQNSNIPLTPMRLADILLVAAEADNEVNQGPSADAYGWINLVRKRAGINDLTGGLSFTAFREAVFIERRKELHGEGFSWFDMKRFNKFDLLNATGRPFGSAIDAHLNYYPISIEETSSNPKVTQNPGWPG